MAPWTRHTIVTLPFILLSVFLLVGSSATAAVTVSGSLPCRDNLSSVRFQVVGSSLRQAEFDKIKANKTEALDISLPESERSDFVLPYSPENLDDIVPFYVQIVNDNIDRPEVSDNNTYTVTFEMILYEGAGASDALEKLIKNGTLKIQAAFDVKENDDSGLKNTGALVKECFAVNVAPSYGEPAAVGSHRSVTVYWKDPGEVAVAGEDDKKEPTGVNIYLVESDVGTETLPARLYKAGQDQDQHEASECTYTAANVGTSENCITCPDNAYLLPAGVVSKGGFKVKAVSKVSEVRTTFTGLDNEKDYVVFMQFDPMGLHTSTCMPASPSPNLSLTELNGEGSAKVVDYRCFIATAAYGSPLHEDLRLFRKFRDDILSSTAPGRVLIDLYYEYSPPLANFIAEHPVLRDTVRALLEIPAGLMKYLEEREIW